MGFGTSTCSNPVLMPNTELHKPYLGNCTSPIGRVVLKNVKLCICTCEFSVLRGQKKVMDSLKFEVIGSCKLPEVGTRT